jgi:hypothetical protein
MPRTHGFPPMTSGSIVMRRNPCTERS